MAGLPAALAYGSDGDRGFRSTTTNGNNGGGGGGGSGGEETAQRVGPGVFLARNVI